MHNFQDKNTILNFLTCAYLHMIEKLFNTPKSNDDIEIVLVHINLFFNLSF